MMTGTSISADRWRYQLARQTTGVVRAGGELPHSGRRPQATWVAIGCRLDRHLETVPCQIAAALSGSVTDGNGAAARRPGAPAVPTEPLAALPAMSAFKDQRHLDLVGHWGISTVDAPERT